MKKYSKKFLKIGLVLAFVPGILTVLCQLSTVGHAKMLCVIPFIPIAPTLVFSPVHKFFEKLVSVFYGGNEALFAWPLAGIFISLFIYTLPLYLSGRYIDSKKMKNVNKNGD